MSDSSTLSNIAETVEDYARSENYDAGVMRYLTLALNRETVLFCDKHNRKSERKPTIKYDSRGLWFGCNEAEIAEMWNHKKIMAIKLHRMRTGCGLKDSKEAVERCMRELQDRGLL